MAEAEEPPLALKTEPLKKEKEHMEPLLPLKTEEEKVVPLADNDSDDEKTADELNLAVVWDFMDKAKRFRSMSDNKKIVRFALELRQDLDNIIEEYDEKVFYVAREWCKRAQVVTWVTTNQTRELENWILENISEFADDAKAGYLTTTEANRMEEKEEFRWVLDIGWYRGTERQHLDKVGSLDTVKEKLNKEGFDELCDYFDGNDYQDGKTTTHICRSCVKKFNCNCGQKPWFSFCFRTEKRPICDYCAFIQDTVAAQNKKSQCSVKVVKEGRGSKKEKSPKQGSKRKRM